MTNVELLQELKHLKAVVDAKVDAAILALTPIYQRAVPKNIGGIVPAKPSKLVTQGQLGMFFAIRKKHDVSDAAKNALLKEFYKVVQECDLPFEQSQQYREDVLNLATESNPHFPVEKYLADGSLNPEWADLETAAMEGV